MAEILQKQMRLGFLLQPEGAHTNTGTNDPVGNGILSVHRWGHPQDAAANYYEILGVVGTPKPDPAIENYTLNAISSNTMFIEEDRAKTNKTAVMPKVEIECYATPVVASAIFMGALQQVSQNQGTASTKKINPYDNTIDYTINNNVTNTYSTGLLFTIAGYGIQGADDPSSDGFILTNAVVDSMTLKISNANGGEERLAKITATFIGQSLQENILFSGTWQESESYIFNQNDVENDEFNLALTIDTKNITTVGTTTFSSGDICWKDFEFSITNNYSSACMTTSGAKNLRRGNPEITGTLNLPHNSATVATFGQYKEGALIALNLTNGYATTVNKHLSIDIDQAQLTANPRSTDGDYIAQQLQFNVLKPTAGWGSLVMISDGVTWGSIESVIS